MAEEKTECSLRSRLCSNDCEVCFKKSFSSHPKTCYWSSKNELPSRMVFKNSNKKFWFDCSECGHEFEKRLDHVNIGSWCSYCSNKRLCNNDKCQLCFNKSFASQQKSKYWSGKNNIKPRQIFKKSNKKFWFDCNECHHEFNSILSDITFGNWCIYCAGHRLCDDNKCQFCFNKSFASSSRIYYWSNKNKIEPRQLFKSSGKSCLFHCPECGYEFRMPLNDIKKGHWCPICKNKTEKKLYEYLEDKYKEYEVIHQVRFNWCQKKRKLPYDFLIEDISVIIELDGGQHFKQVSNWTSPEEIQECDKFKNNHAIENGYTLIRILQEDVYYDKNEWESKLNDVIKKYDKPMLIYLYDLGKLLGNK